MLRPLVGLLVVVAACSAPPAPPSRTREPANTANTAAQGALPRAASSGAEGSPLVAQAKPQGRAFVLELPAEEAFVGAPLPELRPERYRSFAQTSRILVGRSQLYGVDLFPGDASLLTLSDAEGTVRVYERASAKLVGNYRVAGFGPDETGGVLAWPEGAPRFVVASVEGLFLYDARTGGLLETLSREKLDDARWSPDRRVLVARGAERSKTSTRLHFFARVDPDRGARAPASLRALGALELPERVDAWDLSADNRLLATALYPTDDLVVTDLKNGTQILRVPGPTFGGDVAFSPDGRLVAMGGKGLLLVDLLNPARRAYYGHFGNNVDHVRFSPSGDAVVASSYEGRLRIFHWATVQRDGRAALTLSLAQTLRHDGKANVYAFVFEGDGNGIVSASGDQTVRTFRAPRASEASAKPRETTSRTFHALADWARLDPDAARPFPPAPEPSLRDGHYYPPILDGAPRPSSIRPGNYACKIDLMYKLRDCAVWKDDKGHTRLKFGPDNLIELQGVLYDDGPVVRLEGWGQPGSLAADCRGCEKQALHAMFRGGPQRYQGLLAFRTYYDPYTPPAPPAADEKLEDSDDRFPMVLEFRGPANAARP